MAVVGVGAEAASSADGVDGAKTATNRRRLLKTAMKMAQGKRDITGVVIAMSLHGEMMSLTADVSIT